MTINEDQNRIRHERTLRWQPEDSEAGRRRAPASSSATSSACPPSGKAAKGGKVKRSWEEMQAGKSRGRKKGGSKDGGQASWRRTW